MKKWILMFVAVACLCGLLLTACGGEKPDETDTTETSADTTDTTAGTPETQEPEGHPDIEGYEDNDWTKNY